MSILSLAWKIFPRNWPFLRDRRIDSYAPITNRMLDGK